MQENKNLGPHKSCRDSSSSHACPVSPGSRIRHENVDERAGVESIPAEPEEESTKHDERGTVTSEDHDIPMLVKATDTRTFDERSPETRDASHHVHHTTAREIDGTGAEEKAPGSFRLACTQPPI